MRRQIALTSAIGLLIVALVAGTTGGLLIGGFAGYWYGRHDAPAQSTAALSATDAASTREADVSTETKDAIVKRVNPAVVTIENQQKGRDGSEQTASMGSGFIIDNQGHIVTNNHVVDGADALVVVLLDGTKTSATLVGTDSFQDVAVIKMDGDVPGVVPFADSSTVHSGQSVLAIGSALGEFRNTVTDGIIGGVERSLDTGEGYLLGHLIQHDAPINPGNSGGPLLNLKGEVIGMNTAVVRGGFGQTGSEGLGFAIASNAVKSYADEIIAHGAVTHPYVGVSFRSLSPVNGSTATDTPEPVMLVDVLSGGPAATVGLVAGDQIVAVEGVTLDGERQFLNEVYKHAPGDTIRFTVQHQDGGQDEVNITLGERPSDTT
ncbi:MAG TPA: trypsin-like peptidase domain-containing protein [Nitrolancea sp.]